MPRFVIGVDIGQAQDYSVISIVEKMAALRSSLIPPDPLRRDAREQVIDMYKLVWEEVLPIGTDYKKVVEATISYTKNPKMESDHSVVIDATGVGRPVRELFNDYGCIPLSVTITNGMDVGKNDIGPTVPKRDLVNTLMVLLNTDRLKIAKIPDPEGLYSQLQKFKQKSSKNSRSLSYEAVSESVHDDRVMALALAVWAHARNGGISFYNRLKSGVAQNYTRDSLV